MYKHDLTLNNPQELLNHKTQAVHLIFAYMQMYGDTRIATAIVLRNGHGDSSSNLNEAVCIPYSVNTYKKIWIQLLGLNSWGDWTF